MKFIGLDLFTDLLLKVSNTILLYCRFDAAYDDDALASQNCKTKWSYQYNSMVSNAALLNVFVRLELYSWYLTTSI